jgi:hypothetical protein
MTSHRSARCCSSSAAGAAPTTTTSSSFDPVGRPVRVPAICGPHRDRRPRTHPTFRAVLLSLGGRRLPPETRPGRRTHWFIPKLGFSSSILSPSFQLPWGVRSFVRKEGSHTTDDDSRRPRSRVGGAAHRLFCPRPCCAVSSQDRRAGRFLPRPEGESPGGRCCSSFRTSNARRRRRRHVCSSSSSSRGSGGGRGSGSGRGSSSSSSGVLLKRATAEEDVIYFRRNETETACTPRHAASPRARGKRTDPGRPGNRPRPSLHPLIKGATPRSPGEIDLPAKKGQDRTVFKKNRTRHVVGEAKGR